MTPVERDHLVFYLEDIQASVRVFETLAASTGHVWNDRRATRIGDREINSTWPATNMIPRPIPGIGFGRFLP